MRDPKPENIMGEKVVTHSIEHKVDWSILIGALAVIYVSWKVSGWLSSGSDSSEELPEGEMIGIEDVHREEPEPFNP